MQQTTPQAYLIIRLGNSWTDVLRLQPDQTVVVGRSSENQIVVRDERVSRKHAEVSPHAGGWGVRDLGSRNGTQVDDQTINGLHMLQDGETIGVGSCRVTFSRSLAGGFAPRGEPVEGHEQLSLGSQQTAELGAFPTIVNRLSNSQWSSDGIEPAQIASAPRPMPDGRNSDWGFFYRLVFDLVACDSPESAAQVALDRLLERIDVSSGGVVTIEAMADPDDAEREGRRQQAPAPPMAVLAARQPAGSAYHRVSDFLVETVVRDRQAVLARNVQDDSQLSLARESGRRETVSIICAPLREKLNEQEHVVGLLHIYSSGDERMLTDVDLDLVVGVADNLAIALSRQQAKEQLARSLANSRRHIDQLQEQLELSCEMVGQSASLQKVRQAIKRAAPTMATVLVRGESGVGKELVARAIHNASGRRDGPLVCLNCAALAPTLLESELFGHEKGAFTGATDRKIGKFEAADGGTLLLDEIGEMNPELQAKFLRVLEGQPFERLGGHKPIQTSVRVIAATNRDLEEAVRNKSFRADLYYRLRVIEIDVPPLRERLEDIPLLVEYFLNQLRHHAGRRLSGIEPQAMELLSRHSWPGNVRELRNVIERAIVLGGGSTIEAEDLSLSQLGSVPPAESGSDVSAGPAAFQPISLAELEKAHIMAMLRHTDGNKTKASQLLGIERSTLDRKLKRYETKSSR